MSRRVFLHVGTPKSGTTFLQRVLWSHKELVAERGLLLPGASFFDHFRATLDVRDLSGAEHDPAQPRRAWTRLAEEAAGWDGDTLISHELLAAAGPRQADRALGALGPTEVHVVVTARDLVRQIPAEWQESLKHRSAVGFADFVRAVRDADTEQSATGSREPAGEWFWQVQDVADVLDRWGHTLPRSQVHVVTVPEAARPADELWSRFAGLLDLDTSGMDLTRGWSNSSLGAEQAELLRLLNIELGDRLTEPGAYSDMVKTLLAHQLLAPRDGTRLSIGHDDQEFARRRSEQMVADLQRLDVSVVGDLKELVAPVGGRAANAPEVAGEAVLHEGVAALASILERFDSEQRRRRQLRSELDEVRRRLDDVTAERDRRLDDVRHRPLRHVLVEQSVHRPWLARLRGWYRRLRAVLRRRTLQ